MPRALPKIDLCTFRGRAQADKLSAALHKKYTQRMTLAKCLDGTMTSPVAAGRNVGVYSDNGLGVVIHNGRGWMMYRPWATALDVEHRLPRWGADFVVVKAPKSCGHRRMLLHNADTVGLTTIDGVAATSLSLNCLQQFFKYKADDALVSGKLRVVDFTNDEFKACTDAKIPKPPAAGFTIVRSSSRSTPRWHRAGSVLVRDSKGAHFLFGRDEDTYFGCELPAPAASIAEAYKVLMPAQAIGKAGVVRQGEWFFVPCKKPDLTRRLIEFEAAPEITLKVYAAILPRKNLIGNAHNLEASEIALCDNGLFVLNPSVHHIQHAPLNIKGWYSVHENLALRSVSVDGVD